MTEEGYTLTRRDAVAALAAAGVAVAGATALGQEGSDPTVGDHERETLIAVARTVYPDAVEGIPAFVETYVEGYTADRPEHAEAVGSAVASLDDYATERDEARYADLDPERRDELLREIGLDTADPDPDGLAPGRLRYYLVNDLLYALYTSPTGGELVGIENPQGFPGGTDSYQRGPDA
jgi:hypothetical protein